jgi:hypothetical protein
LCLQCSPQFLSIQSCSHAITRSERNTSCVAVRTERSVRLPVHNVPRNVAVHTCCVRRCCSRKVLSDPLCTLLFIPSGPSLCVHALPEGRIGCLGEQLRAARHLPGAETPHIPNARIPRLVAWHAFCSRGGIRFRAVVAVVACMAVDFDRGGHKKRPPRLGVGWWCCRRLRWGWPPCCAVACDVPRLVATEATHLLGAVSRKVSTLLTVPARSAAVALAQMG